MRKMLARFWRWVRRFWRWVRMVASRLPKVEFEYREFEDELERDYKRDRVDRMSAEEGQKWFADREADDGWFEDELNRRRSIYWIRKARRMYVDTPPYTGDIESNEYWQARKYRPNARALTNEGVAFIRQAIREEIQANQEPLLRRLSVAIGIGVVLSPIASVLIALLLRSC